MKFYSLQYRLQFLLKNLINNFKFSQNLRLPICIFIFDFFLLILKIRNFHHSKSFLLKVIDEYIQ